jgi:hypothetical protein
MDIGQQAGFCWLALIDLSQQLLNKNDGEAQGGSCDCS